MHILVKVKKLHHEATIPRYATEGAACFDIHVCEPGKDPITMGGFGEPTVATTFDTGLAFEIPQGHVMLVFSRSGHGFKNDVRLANCVGVIDSDYRGELKVRLTADTIRELKVGHGDRIAQALVMPLSDVRLIEVDELSDTARGTGGFGSTGA